MFSCSLFYHHNSFCLHFPKSKGFPLSSSLFCGNTGTSPPSLLYHTFPSQSKGKTPASVPPSLSLLLYQCVKLHFVFLSNPNYLMVNAALDFIWMKSETQKQYQQTIWNQHAWFTLFFETLCHLVVKIQNLNSAWCNYFKMALIDQINKYFSFFPTSHTTSCAAVVIYSSVVPLSEVYRVRTRSAEL